MNILMNQKHAGIVTSNIDGSYNMHVFDFCKVGIDDIEHSGRGRIRIISNDDKTLADVPVGVYGLENGSVAYISQNLQVVNPEDATTSTNAVIVALYSEFPYDLVVFGSCDARKMTDDEKLSLINACVKRNSGFALAIRFCHTDDFGPFSDLDAPIANEPWLHCDNLDAINLPTWGQDDSFPLLSMIMPKEYC
jgi:hypothetical protein